MNKHEPETEINITNDEDSVEIEESNLQEIESLSAQKIKKLRDKLTQCESEKREILDESLRLKADFLNARKRLQEDRERDKMRYRKQHVEELLPLCDSFQMAMNNAEVWEKADKAWRTGIEGIHNQLQRILESYGVTTLNPVGDHFNPHKHEAVGTEVVKDEKLQDTVVSVVQMGYEMRIGEITELIRPARVTTGTVE